MKQVRLIKMCLNEMYSKVHTCKHLSDNFPVQNGLKQVDALSPLLFLFALVYDIRNVPELLLCPQTSLPNSSSVTNIEFLHDIWVTSLTNLIVFSHFSCFIYFIYLVLDHGIVAHRSTSC
jgi:hypothetical protein